MTEIGFGRGAHSWLLHDGISRLQHITVTLLVAYISRIKIFHIVPVLGSESHVLTHPVFWCIWICIWSQLLFMSFWKNFKLYSASQPQSPSHSLKKWFQWSFQVNYLLFPWILSTLAKNSVPSTFEQELNPSYFYIGLITSLLELWRCFLKALCI